MREASVESDVVEFESSSEERREKPSSSSGVGEGAGAEIGGRVATRTLAEPAAKWVMLKAERSVICAGAAQEVGAGAITVDDDGGGGGGGSTKG